MKIIRLEMASQWLMGVGFVCGQKKGCLICEESLPSTGSPLNFPHRIPSTTISVNHAMTICTDRNEILLQVNIHPFGETILWNNVVNLDEILPGFSILLEEIKSTDLAFQAMCPYGIHPVDRVSFIVFRGDIPHLASGVVDIISVVIVTQFQITKDC